MAGDTGREGAVSLLWPRRDEPPPPVPAARWHTADLNLDPLLSLLVIDPRWRRSTQNFLLQALKDPAHINWRLDVIEDLQNCPALADGLESALDILQTLQGYMARPQWDQDELQKVTWRLGELESLIDCVTLLNDALAEAGPALRSEALGALRQQMAAIAADPLFQELQAELPDLLEQIRSMQAITIGINLDGQLRPVEATLLAIHQQPFRGDTLSFFQRLGGARPGPEGIGPLHRAEDGAGRGARLKEGDSPLLEPLFRDLNDVLNEICRPLAGALRRYTRIGGRDLLLLQEEIAFFLGGLRLIDHLRACGLPVCRPQAAPAEARMCALRGLVNINLALQLAPAGQARPLDGEIVGNDADFGAAGRIFVLTGPNRGGKTTWTQALGLAQVLLQAGLYLPAEAACMSPVDGLFTHFARAENPLLASGRLGEEAQRLAAIFRQATRHSLLLFNESLSSTSAGESFWLARDILRALRLLGARAVFATHLHELAADADAINADTDGDSEVVSLVAQVREDDADGAMVQRTFRIVPGPPLGHSHAREIAAHYGISFEQLRAQLLARNGLTPEAERGEAG
ncbi:MAG: hypothetical protein J4G17_00140 [Anaerolineae bacterium]|nr:hypothetical protein [Anaerolineae bacterium]